MSFCRRSARILLTLFLGLTVPAVNALGDFNISGSFGPNGDVGFVTSPPSLSIGFGASGQGSLYQMDGFVNIPTLNGGTSDDLGNGPPSGIGFAFAASQPTVNQLLLSYTFVNNTGSALPGFQFLYFADPDITGNFANNNAIVNGNTTATGLAPSSFQVGDPSLSTIFTNLFAGTLSNGNDFPVGTPGDVSIGLGFNIANLGIGQSATVQVLLADDGSTLGNFSIQTVDNPSDPNFIADSLTISGEIVPEPSSLVLMAIGGLGGMGLSAARSFRRRDQA